MLDSRAASIVIASLGLALAPGPVRAERLPIRVLTIADGLPRNEVSAVFEDSRGFLWVGTSNGIARYDGRESVVFGVPEGLPSPYANSFAEVAGRLWIGTNDGLARLPLDATPQNPGFEVFSPGESPVSRAIAALSAAPDGTLLTATLDGLYRCTAPGAAPVCRRVDLAGAGVPDRREVYAMLSEPDGAIWALADLVLHRIAPNGHVDHWPAPPGLAFASGSDGGAIVHDRQDRFWIATPYGLMVLPHPPRAGEPLRPRLLTAADGVPGRACYALVETRDGRILSGADSGLAEIALAPDGSPRITRWTQENGLPAPAVTCLRESAREDLWIGTASGGLAILMHDGFTSWSRADGLRNESPGELGITQVVPIAGGPLVVLGNYEPFALAGRRFEPLTLLRPRSVSSGWGWNQILQQDGAGGWWLGTGGGIYYWSADDDPFRHSSRPPTHIWKTADGLASDDVFRVFIEPVAGTPGTVWASLERLEGPELCALEPAVSRFHCFEGSAEVPEIFASAFALDQAGALWIGGYAGKVVRRRRGGAFEDLSERVLSPGAGIVTEIHPDARGRLWLATSTGGLYRVDEPAADQPAAMRYGAPDFSCDQIRCLAEDSRGLIYAGTTRGVDRLDPETGRVRRFTTAHGLSNTELFTAARDESGALWFGMKQGVSRFVPSPARDTSTPRIFITHVRVAGAPEPATGAAPLALTADQRNIQFDFVSPDPAGADAIRYQTRLEGADAGWNEATDARSVSYARLSPGGYRFLVRAVRSDGAVSETPAAIAFNLPAPFWQRGWFLALAALAVAAVAGVIHRQRVRRLVEIERVRTRIATDLHDDIGASLSRVALLAELARRDVERGQGATGGALGQIADTARGLSGSMSDIVWSLDPAHDTLGEVLVRARTFAGELLPAAGIACAFDAPESLDGVPLDAERRRHIYLAMKEAIANIARHSGASHAAIRAALEDGALVIRITDDGRGFEAGDRAGEREAGRAGGSEPRLGGSGLRSLERRAQACGGTIRFETPPGGGAGVTLRIPGVGAARIGGA